MKRLAMLSLSMILGFASTTYSQDFRSGSWPDDQVMFELLAQSEEFS